MERLQEYVTHHGGIQKEMSWIGRLLFLDGRKVGGKPIHLDDKVKAILEKRFTELKALDYKRYQQVAKDILSKDPHGQNTDDNVLTLEWMLIMLEADPKKADTTFKAEKVDAATGDGISGTGA